MRHANDNIYVLVILAMAGATFLVVVFILFQVRHRNKVLRHQKELLHAMIQSQEAERRRIGMDLHDEVGTVLSALRMTVDDRAGREIIDKLIGNVRSIAHNLSPFVGTAYGLTDALEDLREQVCQPGVLEVSLECPPEGVSIPLSPMAALGLYRVIAELMNNTVRHARAGRVDIVLRLAPPLLLADYRDDGIGMVTPNASRGMGWYNIESRCGLMGATLELTTGAGKGMAVHVRIPLLSPTQSK